MIPAEIYKTIEGKQPAEALRVLTEIFPGRLIFTSSFGIEDQVITDIIAQNKLPIKIITLDTGRLFEETYKVMQKTREKYGNLIEYYFPESAEIEELLRNKGPYSFYESVDNRKECCHLRKVRPLNRALSGMQCWITGIRADQSEGRSNMHNLEWDDHHQLIKYHPLFSWSLEQVRDYIKTQQVPYNILHDKGYISIGCAPCTRAIQPGEDFRAGRWWWENNDGKECGLHR